MKKISKLLTIAFATTLLFSCSNDDDNGNNQADIVGKWAFYNEVVNGQTIPYDDHETCGKDYIEFKNDNTFEVVDIWDCEVYVDDEGSYSINGNTLTIMGLSMEISQLTDTQLSLNYSEDYDGDGDLEEVTLNFDRL